MARANPQRGDFTGRETQRLQRENADKLVERQNEIGLAGEVDLVVEEEGVFDPVSGELVEMSPEGQAKVEALNQPIEVEEAEPVYEIGEGPKPLDLMQPFEDTQRTKPRSRKKASPEPIEVEIEDLGDEPVFVEDEYVNIRVNTDIEDMTYGAGNVFSLARGKQYRVSKHIARHLESKGLVYH
jgi:hypothetical protein